MKPNLSVRFLPRTDIAREDFESHSLILLCDSLQLREINAAARQILELLDGRSSVQDIAGQIAAATGAPLSEVLPAVWQALLAMEKQGIVRRQTTLSKNMESIPAHARYLADPDISFRPEEDGGILYHPQTDTLEALNATAAELWKELQSPQTAAGLVAHLSRIYADVPEEQIRQDVAEFLDSMCRKGYVGMVEESA